MDRATRVMVAVLLALAAIGLMAGAAVAVLPPPDLHWQRAGSLVPFVLSTLALLGALSLVVSRRSHVRR